ncbi:hypothetical protein [Cellulomonas telluris]|uniref:hypothetical protein n=1 Tax=Cellulomonas telluris TaxID=2306636 RepID=UPI0014562B2E|nr:hypothetical protein [Cellulomonas telluris]
MEQIETIVREQCVDLLASGRLRVVGVHRGTADVPVCTVASDRLTLTTWIYHGELDGSLRPVREGADSLDLRRALRHLGAEWASTWDREAIMAAFATHAARLDEEAADPERWDALCTAPRRA